MQASRPRLPVLLSVPPPPRLPAPCGTNAAQCPSKCPPGTYGTDPNRLACNNCTAGYVCAGKTSSATPISVEEDGGYMCPAGHYCPEGSFAAIPCDAGSHNPLAGSSKASACVPCGADFYQVRLIFFFVFSSSPEGAEGSGAGMHLPLDPGCKQMTCSLRQRSPALMPPTLQSLRRRERLCADAVRAIASIEPHVRY